MAAWSKYTAAHWTTGKWELGNLTIGKQVLRMEHGSVTSCSYYYDKLTETDQLIDWQENNSLVNNSCIYHGSIVYQSSVANLSKYLSKILKADNENPPKRAKYVMADVSDEILSPQELLKRLIDDFVSWIVDHLTEYGRMLRIFRKKKRDFPSTLNIL